MIAETALFVPPANYRRIKIVTSFEDLVASPLGPEVNAICWPRRLTGNFDELAACFNSFY